jgi:hypothetical protein
MSIQINIGDHFSAEADFTAVPFAHRFAVNWARERAKRIATDMPSADAYFRTLPRVTRLQGQLRLRRHRPARDLATLRSPGAGERQL